MLHVGQSYASRHNLRRGVETCTWGLPKWQPGYRSQRPHFAALATDAAPRTSHSKGLTGASRSVGTRPGFWSGKVDVPDRSATEQENSPAASFRGAGFISGPAKRKASELYAENMAIAHYEELGWPVERLGKPYDLHCTRDGEEKCVEVKGTTGSAAKVLLTSNEVDHARNPQHTVDLYVVGDIRIAGEGYSASEGRDLHFKDWFPADEDLKPRNFDYRLPLGG